MGKYASSAHQRPKPRRDSIPPLVRGIGCILFVLVPIVAYGIARAVVPLTVGWGLPIPPQWFGNSNIQYAGPNLPFLVELVDMLRAEPNLKVNLVFAAIITVLLYGFMTIAYGYVFSLATPSKYGPMDVPPPRVKTKKYRR